MIRIFWRKILKNILKILAKTTIKKHKIKIYIIVGKYGTEYVREASYNFIKQRMNVRRNISKIWWDLSVPLNILGINDSRKNLLEWFFLILKASLQILFIKPHTHSLILDLDTSIKDIASYWSEFIIPNVLVILNYNDKSELISKLNRSLRESKGVLVLNENIKLKNDISNISIFKYGTGVNNNLQYQSNFSKLELKFNNKTKNISSKTIPQLFKNLIAAAVALDLSTGGELDDTDQLYNFEVHPEIINKALNNIKTFIKIEDSN